LKFTEAWPAVQELQRQTNMLAKQIAQIDELTPSSDPSSGPTKKAAFQHPDALNSELNAYSAERVTLAARLREAQMYMTNAPGYCKILAPATEKEVTVKKSGPKIMVMTIFAGVVGFFATLVVLLFLEITDSRLKGPRDVERVLTLQLIAPDRCDRAHRHQQGGGTDQHDAAFPGMREQLGVSGQSRSERAFDRHEHQHAIMRQQFGVLLVSLA